MSLELRPISLRAANDYIVANHRHHGATRGQKFSISCWEGDELVGVVVVGRPVARGLDNGLTAEVTRLCTNGSKNVCSMLYGAAWRCARAMGYHRIVTYILASETGASLRATGWRLVDDVRGRSWSAPSRPREDKHPLGDKVRYEQRVSW